MSRTVLNVAGGHSSGEFGQAKTFVQARTCIAETQGGVAEASTVLVCSWVGSDRPLVPRDCLGESLTVMATWVLRGKGGGSLWVA